MQNILYIGEQLILGHKMANPYIIRISSTKGGVGKSVIAVNLGVALQLYGYRVLVVDIDTINPSIGLYLGLSEVSIGVDEVMQNKSKLERAIIPHGPTGLRVLPGAIERRYTLPSKDRMASLFKTLKGAEYDFIIVDTQPGIPSNEDLSFYDEAIVVALPDEASTISAIKMLKNYGDERLKVSVLANRVTGKAHELSIREIEEMCKSRITGWLSEDSNVGISIAQHIPVYLKRRNSPFSKHISKLSSVYTSRSRVDRLDDEDPRTVSYHFIRILNRIFKRQD